MNDKRFSHRVFCDTTWIFHFSVGSNGTKVQHFVIKSLTQIGERVTYFTVFYAVKH